MRHTAIAAARTRISVIIPTLNEQGNLPATLQSAFGAPDVEVIVVDGHSGDGTAAIARSAGARVITSTAGRANQMNAGAAVARGDVLVFLHADTRLPADFADHVLRTVEQPGAVAGAFALSIDGPGRSLRFIERTVGWRSRYLQLPYGDQAIFLTAERFAHMGGYAAMPVMEDFDLVRRLRRTGRIVTVPAAVVTSPRRWQTRGTWRTTLTNQAIIAAYLLGVSPQRLAQSAATRRVAGPAGVARRLMPCGESPCPRKAVGMPPADGNAAACGARR